MVDLENYRIIKNLGSGAFGSVKSNPKIVAQHLLTKTSVAIKIIKKQLAIERNVLVNIKREVNYMRKFDHPNIVKL